MTCLTPKCGKALKRGSCRGLCTTCYTNASYLVRKQKTTWKELIQRGLCAPDKNISLLSRALEESRNAIDTGGLG